MLQEIIARISSSWEPDAARLAPSLTPQIMALGLEWSDGGDVSSAIGCGDCGVLIKI